MLFPTRAVVLLRQADEKRLSAQCCLLRSKSHRCVFAGAVVRKRGIELLKAADELLEALFCFICCWSLCFGLFACLFVCLFASCLFFMMLFLLCFVSGDGGCEVSDLC